MEGVGDAHDFEKTIKCLTTLALELHHKYHKQTKIVSKTKTEITLSFVTKVEITVQFCAPVTSANKSNFLKIPIKEVEFLISHIPIGVYVVESFRVAVPIAQQCM